MELPMFQKALAASIGTAVLSPPFMKTARQPEIEPPASGSAASAGLSVEEDFELTREFLETFSCAGERVASFVVGCSVIAAIWLAVSML
jgi:hypothetical protein